MDNIYLTDRRTKIRTNDYMYARPLASIKSRSTYIPGSYILTCNILVAFSLYSDSSCLADSRLDLIPFI